MTHVIILYLFYHISLHPKNTNAAWQDATLRPVIWGIKIYLLKKLIFLRKSGVAYLAISVAMIILYFILEPIISLTYTGGRIYSVWQKNLKGNGRMINFTGLFPAKR